MAILNGASDKLISPEKSRVAPGSSATSTPIVTPKANAQPAASVAANSNAAPASDAAPAASGLRIAAILLRTAFIFILMVLVIRVSQPQSETIWSAYETPGDLVRLWLGIGACVWLLWQLFAGPKDAHGYRTWLYLGFALVPFSLICLVAIW
jgi:hypothetical protein